MSFRHDNDTFFFGMSKSLGITSLEHLDEIKIPTLVIVGEKEIVDFWAISEVLAQQIPNATKVVIKGVGHMSNMEDAMAFNRSLHLFLSKVR